MQASSQEMLRYWHYSVQTSNVFHICFSKNTLLVWIEWHSITLVL